MDVTLAQIADRIRRSIQSPHDGSNGPCDAAFDMPVIGVCSALHRLFDQTQGRDPTKISPTKWLDAAFGTGYAPDRISIISWALPMPESARAAMRSRENQPAMEWLAARARADEINRIIASDLVSMLDAWAIHAVAPLAQGLTQRRSIEQYGSSLYWSEPTAAVATGVGALRPSCGVVTRLGASVTLGSVIVAATVPGSAGPLSLDGLCGKADGCLACQARCPVGAIGPAGFDQSLCLKYQSQFVLPYLKMKFEYDGRAGCDLCLTGVPCEFFP